MSENGQNGRKHRGNTAGLRPPWKKGESGNPRGRPKGTGLTDRLRAALEVKDDDGVTAAQRLVDAGVKAALDGDHRFWQSIYERIEGKAIQRVEIDTSVKAVPDELLDRA